MNYSKNPIPEITTADASRGSCRDSGGMLSPEPELPDQLTGLWEDWRAVRMKIAAEKIKPSRDRGVALLLRCRARSKTFRVESNSYNSPITMSIVFQSLRNGRVLALTRNRRSGAQRGASENNFGQRFSVRTPCFISRLGWPSPPSFS